MNEPKEMEMKVINKKIIILIITLAFIGTIVNANPGFYDIRDFGAQGDGKTLATEAINKAISACSESDGGIVRVSGGIYVSGTVFMKSNVGFRKSCY